MRAETELAELGISRAGVYAGGEVEDPFFRGQRRRRELMGDCGANHNPTEKNPHAGSELPGSGHRYASSGGDGGEY